jgi:hypothetical protein
MVIDTILYYACYLSFNYRDRRQKVLEGLCGIPHPPRRIHESAASVASRSDCSPTYRTTARSSYDHRKIIAQIITNIPLFHPQLHQLIKSTRKSKGVCTKSTKGSSLSHQTTLTKRLSISIWKCEFRGKRGKTELCF